MSTCVQLLIGMDSTFVITNIQVFDIFFRFATAGLLGLYIALVGRIGDASGKYASVCLFTCLIAYVLLTAPIPNENYGWLRPPLLLFTNCASYALFAVYWHKVRGQSLLQALPAWLKVTLGGWLVWLLYFFLVEKGAGVFLRIHHGIGLSILAAMVVDASRDFSDDLVKRRRDTRLLAIVLICLYITVLSVVELFFKPAKDHWLFSLTNACLIFTSVSWFLWRFLDEHWRSNDASKERIESAGEAQVAPLSDTAKTLSDIMTEGYFTENGLTVGKLAAKVGVAEHHLRNVINQELGFDNFSHYLNSYRIPAIAKELVAEENKNTPILTLALDKGFNSIATFNRAFKSVYGVTPSAYRQQKH